MNYDILINALETLPNLIIVDHRGKIIYLNEKYAQFLGVNKNDVIGKNVTEVVPNTRMHIVIQSGKDEIGEFMQFHDHHNHKDVTLVCNRLAIKDKEKTIGAIAMTTLSNLTEIESLEEAYSKLAEENKKMKKEIQTLRNAVNPLEKIIGKSPLIKELKNEISTYAKSNLPILITGETGVGKEVAAEAIHALSNRCMNNYIKINCAAIPGELLESELFGYEEGAFSGARKGGKTGKFELADNGTILLDEIGDMPMHLQAKLLRVLQEGVIDRIGSTESKPVNVRIICSTNCNLEDLIKEKKFREDLYYRINVVELSIPPLRTRVEDLELLVNHFIHSTNSEENLDIQGIKQDALTFLKQYSWQGNIRELKHVIQRAVVLCKSNILEIQDFNFMKKNKIHENADSDSSLKNKVDLLEKKSIEEALSRFKGNKSKTAKYLDIDRSLLYKKLKKYNLD